MGFNVKNSDMVGVKKAGKTRKIGFRSKNTLTMCGRYYILAAHLTEGPKMAKKIYFFLFDTETTQDSMVADFAGIICDKSGKIYAQIAVLVNGIYTDSENHPLFHIHGDDSDLWSKAGLPKRYARYNAMVSGGSRMIASIGAINRWLDRAKAEFDPYLTAYNLAFDVGKCENTGIDLTMFDKRFCLWYASYSRWAKSKNYRQFILDHHFFKNPTQLGNMSWSTNAETMARFVLGNSEYPDEPHTALEDVIDYELPILKAVVKGKSQKIWSNPEPWNWRDLQVKDWYKPI